MNTGRFKLDKTTLAIDDLSGKLVLVSVTIPLETLSSWLQAQAPETRW